MSAYHPKRLRTPAFGAAAVAALLALAGCNEDDPVAPARGGGGGNAGTVTVSLDQLDFGIVCFGQDKTLPVTITASADNTGDVTGRVELSSSTSYNIESGGGDYTLAPGDSRVVTVRYNPQALFRTHQTTLDVGVGDVSVACTGYSSEKPYVRIEPAAGDAVAAYTNYKPFAENGAIVPVKHTNIDYTQAGWQQCRSQAWVCNGNSITESTLGVRLKVPTGTTSVRVTIMMEVEDTCTQFMVEVDGSEKRWEGFSGTCSERIFTVPVTPGQREIRVGTDQSAFCSGDLAIWRVKFEFNRPCLSPSEVN